MFNKEKFEAWYKKEIDAGECFMRNKDNPEHYLSLNVHFADKCWQAALASQAQQPAEAKPYGYAVEEADGEVKFFSTFDRPAESYAFKVKTRKVVPLYVASQAQQERKVSEKDFILRGTDCEYLCTIENKWIPAKFLTLSFGGAEPLVQASGRMPVFCTWNTFRGIEKQVIFNNFLLPPAPEGDKTK